MKRVVIVKSFDREFRIPFYRQLITELKSRGIELQLVSGQPDKFLDDDKDIVRDIPFGTMIRNRYFYFGRRFIVWQPALSFIRKADLVIVQQGNAHLLNYLLFALRKLWGFKLAFWGHGRNFQAAKPHGIRETFKRIYSMYADHWFAYTERTSRILMDWGFPEESITTVFNTIDTKQMIADYESIDDKEIIKLRNSLGINEADTVAIYCGRFYKDKDMDFTLEAAKIIREQDDRFHFILIGHGSETQKIESFCNANSGWAHYVGPRYGKEKAAFFKIADCQMMPGAVGLNIVDSFVLLTPIITKRNPYHGPETDYLLNYRNGIMSEDNLADYTKAIMDFIVDRKLQNILIEGCKVARRHLTIENMAVRFADGVCKIIQS